MLTTKSRNPFPISPLPAVSRRLGTRVAPPTDPIDAWADTGFTSAAPREKEAGGSLAARLQSSASGPPPPQDQAER